MEQRIKNIRSQLGWTQADLAKYMNVSVATVARWEIGVRSPNEVHKRILIELENRLSNMSSDKKKKNFANQLANLAIGGGIIWLIAWLFKDDFN